MLNIHSVIPLRKWALAASPRSSARLVTLDIFRGLCIVGMVLVNYPGDPTQVFAPIRHVEWHGWTLADLIAPGFLWVIGVVVPLTIRKNLAAGLSYERLQMMILRRSVMLYALGMLVDTIPALNYLAREAAWAEIPALGILQRIAVCYALAASAFLWGGLRGTLGAAAACIGIYVAALYAFSFFSGHADRFSPQANFATWFDGLILGTSLNSGQGLITALTGTVTTLSGIAVGCYVGTGHEANKNLLLLALIGTVSLVLGEALDRWIPINRYLWTPTFVLTTSGISMLLFVALDYFTHWDMFVQAAKPLIVIGLNPITIYCLAAGVYGLAASVGVTGLQGEWVSLWTLGYEQFLRLNLPPRLASLAMAAMYIMAIHLVAQFFNHRGWYIRI